MVVEAGQRPERSERGRRVTGGVRAIDADEKGAGEHAVEYRVRRVGGRRAPHLHHVS